MIHVLYRFIASVIVIITDIVVVIVVVVVFFFFSSRRRHTRYWRDWSSDVCSSDLIYGIHLDQNWIDDGHRSYQNIVTVTLKPTTLID